MTPYYSDSLVTLWLGDCRELLPSVEADVVVTDPPYGIGYRTPTGKGRREGRAVRGDAEPFDPRHLLDSRPAAIFGGNHFAHLLPPSAGWIVWDKRLGTDRKNQGDAELVWTSFLGSVRIIRHPWNGGGTFYRENGSPESLHPTQKPVALMRAILALTPPGVVVDPYAGSGSTLVAAKSMGRRAVGIEIDPEHCETAANRLSQEVLGLLA